MNSDHTEIVVILDRSGSMHQGRDDHEGGLASFVQDQKQLPGHVSFTLIQFDTESPCEVVYDGVPISEVGEITLIPRGGTPLLDAMGKAIAHVDERLQKLDEKPDQIVAMVITDGCENSSHEYTRETVKRMVTEHEENGWRFLYLGADVDAFDEAGGLAIDGTRAATYHSNGESIRSLYGAFAENMLASREMLQQGASPLEAMRKHEFTEKQRKKMDQK